MTWSEFSTGQIFYIGGQCCRKNEDGMYYTKLGSGDASLYPFDPDMMLHISLEKGGETLGSASTLKSEITKVLQKHRLLTAPFVINDLDEVIQTAIKVEIAAAVGKYKDWVPPAPKPVAKKTAKKAIAKKPVKPVAKKAAPKKAAPKKTTKKKGR